jgi:YXWGXW repeat-containing protein
MKTKYIIRLLLLALITFAIPATAPTASAAFGIGISVGFAPPALPIYAQPICPGDGYLWTPGYWAYADSGYYWVPGVWVLPPQIGFLWTPGYWGWGGGGYFWHGGYWGPHIGFYGGVNYGFGYFGHGYEGGYWNHNHFFYNRSVNNVNITNIHNTYNRTVINNRNDSRVSFNGGRGGINARPTSGEMAANRDRHIGATGMQSQQEHVASTNRAQFASANHGRPAVAAAARPGEFSNRNAAATRGNESRPLNTTRAANRDAFTRGSNGANTSRSANNNQHDNSFARSQNNATRAQGNTSRQQQFNTQRGTQNSSRQFASRSSNSAPAQRNNATRQQSSQVFHQNAARSTQQHASAPRQQSNAGRSAPQTQSRGESHTTTNGGNNGGHGARR